MIVDVHTHPHRRSVKYSQGNYDNYNIEDEWLPDGSFKPGLVEEYVKDMAMVDKVIVLAVDCPYWIHASNELTAAFAKCCGPKVIPFASVNPNSPTAVEDLDHAVRDLGLRGIKLAPIYQNFVPDSRAAYKLYAKISELHIPIIWHQGNSMIARFGPIEEANPIRLDKVLRDFPDIKMCFSHLGVPWAWEAVSMAHKHPQLYVDISAMMTSRWFAYNALVFAYEGGVMDKLLFGSDYPWYSPAETRDALFSLTDLPRGTGLPQIPLEALEAIVNRDAVQALGL